MGNRVVYKENGEVKEIEFDELNNIDEVEIIKDENIDDFEGGPKGKIIAITPFVCTIIYLILGFYLDLWHPGWVVFLLIPIVPVFLKIFSGNRGSIIALLTLIIIAGYLLCGFFFQWWHPGWIIFLLIPIIGIIFGHDD